MIRIGIDTGGTFTDFAIVSGGRLSTWKEPSTPEDPSRAILAGLARILGGAVAGAEVIHGSTVATNALLEGRTSRVAFVTNRGFEDLLEIGRQARPDLYDLQVQRPEPLAPRDLRFGLAGRMTHDGSELEPIDPEEAGRLGLRLAQHGVEAVALCLLHSYASGRHEEEAARALAAAGLQVSVSSRLVPEYREFERASTVAVNAAVCPIVSRYLGRLQQDLAAAGAAGLRVMASNGGALSARSAGEEAVRTVLSGPAGGVTAARHVGEAMGRPRLITFDMGGTSTDVCLIDGRVRTTGESTVAGHPIRIPTIDIHTVGAGGGSIAWRDAGGALRVGPASAGAEPGPACYGRGGPPTVTDANLLLGRIVPELFLDGRMPLQAEASRRAVGALASELGLTLVEAAEGIVRVAEATMARAIRVISLQRGHEPADFSLLAFGGAGGLHAASLAASLGIVEVILPERPGVFSAFGMTVADVLKDRCETLLVVAGPGARAPIQDGFTRLEEACGRDLIQEGIPAERQRLERSLDARYRGQSHEIEIPFTPQWEEAFHLEHQRRFGYQRPGAPVEAVVLRVRGVGKVERAADAPAPRAADRETLPAGRVVWGSRWLDATLLHREAMPAPDGGSSSGWLAGPAILVESGATTFVPPGWRARADRAGRVCLTQMDGGEPAR